jgi:RNA polymerase sigma-70 factor, ECF subfamily
MLEEASCLLGRSDPDAKLGALMAVSRGGSSSDPRAPEASRAVQAQLSRASDAELGRALIDADPEAFYVAWQRFLPLVRHMVRRVLGRAAEADDIVQEIFFSLFRSVRNLRDPVTLRAFVMAITVRTLSYEQRRQRRRSFLTLETEEQTEGLRITADPASKHAFVSFQHLVSRLRERERTALMLRFVQGMGADEIGEALGVSAPTARRSFARAIERLSTWASRDPFLVDYLKNDGGDAEET